MAEQFPLIFCIFMNLLVYLYCGKVFYPSLFDRTFAEQKIIFQLCILLTN